MNKFSEYELIAKYYVGKKAKRSGLPYMKHIDDGLQLLSHLQYDTKFTTAKAGFCLHPLYQDNIRVANFGHSSRVAYLYSIIANTFLRHNYIDNSFSSYDLRKWIPSQVNIGLCINSMESEDVRLMLIADKVQNYKDFKRFEHKYNESQSIEKYFLWWFDTLEITHTQLKTYLGVIS